MTAPLSPMLVYLEETGCTAEGAALSRVAGIRARLQKGGEPPSAQWWSALMPLESESRQDPGENLEAWVDVVKDFPPPASSLWEGFASSDAWFEQSAWARAARCAHVMPNGQVVSGWFDVLATRLPLNDAGFWKAPQGRGWPRDAVGQALALVRGQACVPVLRAAFKAGYRPVEGVATPLPHALIDHAFVEEALEVVLANGSDVRNARKQGVLEFALGYGRPEAWCALLRIRPSLVDGNDSEGQPLYPQVLEALDSEAQLLGEALPEAALVRARRRSQRLEEALMPAGSDRSRTRL